MSPIREYEKHTMKNKKTTQLHRGDLDPLIKILESKGVDVRSIVTTLAMVEQSDPKYQADGRALVLEMAIIAAMGNREGRKKPAEPNAPAERQKRRTIADLEAELRTLMQSEIPATRGQIGEAMGCSPGQVDRVLESMRPDLKVEGEGPKATYVLRQTVLDGALASKVTSALQQAAPIRPKPPKKAAKKVSKSEAKKKSKKAVAKKKAPERTPPKAPTKAANEKPPNKPLEASPASKKCATASWSIWAKSWRPGRSLMSPRRAGRSARRA